MADLDGEEPGARILLFTRLNVGRYDIEWRIDNFVLFDRDSNEKIESPIFKTGPNSMFPWRFELYPKGIKNHEGFISIYVSPQFEEEVTATYKISLLDEKREKGETRSSKKQVFTRKSGGWGYHEFIKRELLLEKKNGYLVRNGLTIHCELNFVEKPVSRTQTAATTHSKLDRLSDDFSNLFNSSKMSDVKMFVGEKQFNVHKLILSARSSVFAAMFDHDLQENRNNEVHIEDIREDVVEEMIRYLYSGRCSKLEEMAEDLLSVSDKYDLAGLKELCEEKLIEQMTVENVVRYLVLGERHGGTLLKGRAVEFIATHSSQVLKSLAWQQVAAEQPQYLPQVYSAVIEHNILMNQVQYSTDAPL